MIADKMLMVPWGDADPERIKSKQCTTFTKNMEKALL